MIPRTDKRTMIKRLLTTIRKIDYTLIPKTEKKEAIDKRIRERFENLINFIESLK